MNILVRIEDAWSTACVNSVTFLFLIICVYTIKTNDIRIRSWLRTVAKPVSCFLDRTNIRIIYRFSLLGSLALTLFWLVWQKIVGSLPETILPSHPFFNRWLDPLALLILPLVINCLWPKEATHKYFRKYVTLLSVLAVMEFVGLAIFLCLQDRIGQLVFPAIIFSVAAVDAKNAPWQKFFICCLTLLVFLSLGLTAALTLLLADLIFAYLTVNIGQSVYRVAVWFVDRLADWLEGK